MRLIKDFPDEELRDDLYASLMELKGFSKLDPTDTKGYVKHVVDTIRVIVAELDRRGADVPQSARDVLAEPQELGVAGLAQAMLDWRQKKMELDAIEAKIVTAVLDIGKTQTVGDVRATYSAGRRTFGYQQAVDDYSAAHPEDLEFSTLIAVHTRVEVSVDCKAVCDEMKIVAPVIKQGEPSVTVKLL